MPGIFIVLLKPGFVFLPRNACISANRGKNGGQVLRGNCLGLGFLLFSSVWFNGHGIFDLPV